MPSCHRKATQKFRKARLEDSETNSRLHVLLALSLTIGLGSRVEVRLLSDADAALTGAEAVVVVVVGCGVEGGAVVPDGF